MSGSLDVDLYCLFNRLNHFPPVSTVITQHSNKKWSLSIANLQANETLTTGYILNISLKNIFILSNPAPAIRITKEN